MQRSGMSFSQQGKEGTDIYDMEEFMLYFISSKGTVNHTEAINLAPREQCSSS